MESPAKLGIDLARVVEMESAEGKAIVDQQVAVVDIQCVDGNVESLAEILSSRQIELRVAGQIRIGELRVGRSVRKSRAVVEVSGDERLPRQIGRAADVQGVALIVVERAPSRWRRHADDQAAGESSLRLRDLIGVGQMKLRAIPQVWRAQ